MSRTNVMPKIVSEVTEFLRSRGHICPIYFTNTQKLEWCCNDECLEVQKNNQMKKRNDENEKFAEELIKNGHTCVYYMESYPVQIGWCRQEQCVNKCK
jgi:hypothetical protein